MTEAKKVVKKYAKKLEKEKYPFDAIYLFGSYSKGKAKKWSDMDVAVVSDKLKRSYDKNKLLLWKFRMDVDLRIEPHGFTRAEFKNKIDPLVYEIRKTGIRVA